MSLVLSCVCRAVVLRLVGLCVLLFTLWGQVTCSGNPDEEDCQLCRYNYKLYPVILLLLGLSLKTLFQKQLKFVTRRRTLLLMHSWNIFLAKSFEALVNSNSVKGEFTYSYFWCDPVLGDACRTGDVQADRVRPAHRHCYAGAGGVPTKVCITSDLVQRTVCSGVTLPRSPVCPRQDGGRQLVQQAGAEAGTTGICGSLQRAGAGVRSDCGLDRGSLLPAASTHQHGQVYHPLLLQEGEHVTAALGPHTRHSAVWRHWRCSLSPLLWSILRSRSSVTADQRWEPSAPPPLPSSSWWSSCWVGFWPQLWWFTVLLREHFPPAKNL